MTDKPRAADSDATGSVPGGSATAGAADGRSGERVVIRDKRRIDPTGGQTAGTGEAEGPADGDGPDPSGAGSAQDGAGPAADDSDHATGARHRRDEDGKDSGAEPTAEAGASGPDRSGDDDSDDDSGGDGDQPAARDAEPDSPVVDEQELAQVLADNQPEATQPVVDEPTPPVGGPVGDGAGPLGAELEALRAELDERTSDVQRVSAEYANYRKRVDRDRGLVADQAIGTVLVALLPILDDLDRAREHGDLVGPFGTVAEQLTTAVGKFGLIAFGEKGDPFDPTRHEAVAHRTSAEVSEPTCVEVMRRGYLLGERLLRPALVAVADPE